ncbi:recombinase family protein [Puerhibacterium puerhi]|uniref:recombinase family protein n=1 Tax=Puerhibacterium puerhi TaxID=2692623 RepID=UPI001359866A|nr:recombinase family protein [Puerhibacterium puerhi]
MLLGYERVSTRDQSPALQRDALVAAGCDRIWTETASGTRAARPELDDLLSNARAGDVLVVWRLDRLGRSVKHLVAVIESLAARGIEFRSLTEGIDTTTPNGRLTFHIFAAIAEFEAALTRERTHAGLAAARDRGRVGGRPRALAGEKAAAADRLLEAPGARVTSVARALGVSRATIYRHVAATQVTA